MRRPSTDLPLSDDPASRYLPWTVGLLVFLATLSLTVGMFLASAGDNWRRSLTGTLTIQVPAGADQQSSVQSAIELLRASPGVGSVRRIPDSEISTMLEPWLGADVSALDLPMPVLIDAEVLNQRQQAVCMWWLSGIRQKSARLQTTLLAASQQQRQIAACMLSTVAESGTEH